MRRRGGWLPRRAALALCATLAFGGATAQSLPLRNLLVEVRQGEAAVLEASGAAGSVGVVARDGRVDVRAGVAVDSRTLRREGEAVQQMLVINGGRASLRVGAQVPMHWVQWAMTTEGPVAWLGGELVDTGRRVVVQPRWPGGGAAVTVEVQSESGALSGGGAPTRYAPDGLPLPEGSVERTGVLTTLQLPLGEWVTVARSGEQQGHSVRGQLSTQSMAGAHQQVLQMRVTAP